MRGRSWWPYMALPSNQILVYWPLRRWGKHRRHGDCAQNLLHTEGLREQSLKVPAVKSCHGLLFLVYLVRQAPIFNSSSYPDVSTQGNLEETPEAPECTCPDVVHIARTGTSAKRTAVGQGRARPGKAGQGQSLPLFRAHALRQHQLTSVRANPAKPCQAGPCAGSPCRPVQTAEKLRTQAAL